MRNIFILVFALAILVSSTHIALALTITDVQAPTLEPGKEGSLVIEVENDQDEDLQDVSLSLDLSDLPLSSVGSSQDSFDEIDEDDEGRFSFILRASTDAVPANYNIPYTLTYSGLVAPKKGTIGVRITAKSSLDLSLSTETPVIGQQGKVSLKVINKGLADARFVSVTVQPEGYTLLSEEQVYIGTIDSDDFESASFDVIFNKERPTFLATLEYLDLDNKKVIQNVELPFKVYTLQKAQELGIIKKSSIGLYLMILVVIVILWLVYRSIRKRMRAKKQSAQAKSS